MNKSFEDTYFVEISKKDVRTLSDFKRRVPKRIANINPSLQYYSILLTCKFSGKPRKKPDRKKETKRFRQNYCNGVEVMQINLEHNIYVIL